MIRKLALASGLITIAVMILALVVVHRNRSQRGRPSTPAADHAPGAPSDHVHPSFLYGRVATVDGANYEGRLRWGGDQEAFWDNYFNGFKQKNPWAVHVPAGRIPMEQSPIKIFGITIGSRTRPANLGRPFMARFGDIARIEAHGRDVWVTLKSGASSHLDRYSSSDFDDGVTVWSSEQGVINLDTLRIRTIDLLPAPSAGAPPNRLHGTVRARTGSFTATFTGAIQWDREECTGSDEINGDTNAGPLRLRFDAIRAIARHSNKSSLLTLFDGREIVLSGTRDAGDGSRGVYVDDLRYSRVLISWDAFERVEFTPGPSGPAYDEFPPGGPLTGTVTTRDGRRLSGRLVYDLDESEFTETLDAPAFGVNYTIPFGLITSILLPDDGAGSQHAAVTHATVTLRSGELLKLECSGDLGEDNAGMLIFADVRGRPEYVSWSEVKRIDLNRPPAMYPPGMQPLAGERPAQPAR